MAPHWPWLLLRLAAVRGGAVAPVIENHGHDFVLLRWQDAPRLHEPALAYRVFSSRWALSYLKAEHEEWYADGSYGGAWRDEVDAALGELDRALGDGGVAGIFETQGTATAAPRRGGSHLYAHLRDRGFAESCVRTDYSFSTPAAALETLTFFFGKGVASRAAELLRGAPPDEPCTVPECTGVWVRRKRLRVRVRIRAAGSRDVVCEIG